MNRMRALYGTAYKPTFRGQVLLNIFDRSARGGRLLMPDSVFGGELSGRYRDELAALTNAGLVPELEWRPYGWYGTQLRAFMPTWTRYPPVALVQVAFQRAITPGPLMNGSTGAPYPADVLAALEGAHDAGAPGLAAAWDLARKTG